VGLGYGLLTAIFNGGVFLGIPLVGSLKDLTGLYGPSFWLMACMALCSSVTALFLVRSREGVKDEE
jgi:predicted MFS family arabinose efflux permease